MRNLRWVGVCLVVMAATAGSLNAAGLDKSAPYTVTLDLTGGPADKLQPLDENEVVARCRDANGCTIWLKIDGPAGLKTDVSRLALSGYSLSYRSTSIQGMADRPFVDADNLPQILAQAQIVTPKGTVSCAVTDLDRHPDGSAADDTEGFLVDAHASAPNLGENTCVVSIVD